MCQLDMAHSEWGQAGDPLCLNPHYMWNTELDPFLKSHSVLRGTPRRRLFDSPYAAWEAELQMGERGIAGLGPRLTRADVQALAVLLQPLDPLLQLPKERVIQQQLLTLGARDSHSAGALLCLSLPPRGPLAGSPLGAVWLPGVHTHIYS